MTGIPSEYKGGLVVDPIVHFGTVKQLPLIDRLHFIEKSVQCGIPIREELSHLVQRTGLSVDIWREIVGCEKDEIEPVARQFS